MTLDYFDKNDRVYRDLRDMIEEAERRVSSVVKEEFRAMHRKIGICDNCGGLMVAKRPSTKCFCSDKCRIYANRKNKEEQR